MKLQVKKILVPTDFSETGMLALEHATNLARMVQAELLLMHVLPLSEYHFEIPEPIMFIDNQEEVNNMVTKKLDEIATSIKRMHSVAVRYVNTRGNVAREIIQLAKDEQVDLIMMGTHGAKGFEEMFIGSNAHKVVTLATCPVITVQTHATKMGFSNIVLPIDRSRHSREKVSVAIDLASLYNSKLHIVGLLEDPEESEYNKLQIVLDQVQSAIEHAKLPFTRHTVRGKHLAAEALKYGESVAADLIIIMTDDESEMSGIFLAPLAKQIVNHSRIPVMSLKPHYGTFESIPLGGSSNAFY